VNKQEKERYKKMLLEKKEDLNDQMSELFNESKDIDTGDVQDVGDKAESSYTKEFLLSLSDSERKQLFLIDEALKRLEKDGFGTCQSCGKEISKKRLAAIPWAPNCIECQQKEEEESS
jgi:DnaK suppressor protein